ncbi:MAG: hypothetical protein ACMUJM_16515 [bacterium]
MNLGGNRYAFILISITLLFQVWMMGSLHARIKLVALPERDDTIIRLDNPHATLIEEERVLTLQKGVNKVDFSWNGVEIDVDSIRLTLLSHPDQVKLLNVSYPPNEAALVWEISSAGAWEETVRISYLLSNIDRLITYKAIADKEESKVDLKSYLVLRNFSGEDFKEANVQLDYGKAFEQGISHEETKQLLFLKCNNVPITKIWTFDAAHQPWDPEKLDINVGIPVSYRIENSEKMGLGTFALWGGKVRVFQDDGHGSTIVLGEDRSELVPIGEKMEVYIGDSRDIVVTQRKMLDKKINVRRNNSNRIVLYDTDEVIEAKIENFKDKSAVLTMIQHIPGQWDMEKCTFEYTRKDAHTLEFEITLPPQGKKELSMHYHRRNVR